ncbi:flavin reductase (DIM6/NTAB) family NADH-FMN oxidoreductase RutF [Paraburkholderia youngii]|uniref:Flavin reductase family protein n=2 Tax=Paraburkholderia youngii TaxID=2782701 RepID=A0ABX2NTR5_9BURK|nr:flavin reductase family protein [Paraburkholderia youngii]NVI07886.1 flavin reductase family protein [Paraburkholderia youngii]
MTTHLNLDALAPGGRRFDSKHFRSALGQFPTGVTVITTRTTDGRRIGLTANSFSSLSMDPPLILWSLAKPSPSMADFVATTHFAINMLADDQQHLSRTFSTASADKFAGVPCVDGTGGVPLIDGSAAHFVCRNVGQYDGGDHLIFIGGVEEYESFGRAPLVFHAGAYRVVSPHPHSHI